MNDAELEEFSVFYENNGFSSIFYKGSDHIVEHIPQRDKTTREQDSCINYDIEKVIKEIVDSEPEPTDRK